MGNLKKLLKDHILTVCAAVSLIALMFDFVIVSTSVEVMGNAGGSTVTTNGFAALGKSVFAYILIIGPVLIAAMNYVKQLEKYKSILAILIPVVCVVSLIIVFFQVQGASASASAAGGMVSAKVNSSMGFGAILALISYVATGVAGAVELHGFTFDKAGLEKLKKSGAALAGEVKAKVGEAKNAASSVKTDENSDKTGDGK